MREEIDADWVAACEGESDAFGRVFDRHYARVRRHCSHQLASRADIDDAVAIAFFELWRNRTRVRTVNGSVLPWLLVTATNSARNLNRSRRRYDRLLRQLPLGEASIDPTDAYAQSEAIAALSGLPLIERQVLSLCVLEGFSEREAAQALAVPVGTVKSRLHRAKGRLRESMGPRPEQVTIVKEAGS